jgi:thiol:disulfide interchange protein
MKKILASLFICSILAQTVFAQIVADPTTWTFTSKKIKEGEVEVNIKVKLKKEWHIWSLTPGGDGMLISPQITFSNNKDIKPIGKLTEKGKLLSKEFIKGDGLCNYFENEVTYTQKFSINKDTKLNGSVYYQTCNEQGSCLIPKTKKFTIEITDAVAKVADTIKQNTNTASTPTVAPVTATSVTTTATVTTTPDSNTKAVATAENNPTEKAEGPANENVTPTANASTNASSSLLSTWGQGFGWGLASVVTPCVFAMLPMTIGFFLKRSKTKAEGRKNAFIYAFSIIAILTLLGALISVIGGNALNNFSTNWIVNLVFFAIFLVFGISFLGAFEITLPSSFSTATDSKANTNSVIGIFFMALTLVIVSFSCTGPFLGNMLISSVNGGRIGPMVGFNGFAVGMALPFAITALFPTLLNKLTQGGWLNAVKVVFGFVELALALKFLSNADLAMQWRLLDREIFIAIWFVLALLLGLYLLGIIKFSHDDHLPENHFGVKYLSVTRTAFAIAALSFAIYLLPGMWGAPLKGMSAFLPPMGTQDYVVSNGGGGTATSVAHSGGTKYAEKMKIYEPESVRNFGLTTYFDYSEALAASKELKKPIMLDFTGINCVNCRKMEAEVWSNPEVLKRLKDNFIIASLYCDMDNITLPEAEQYESKYLGAKVTTLGDLNEDLQATKFNANSQPYYFYVDAQGALLADKGYPYDPNVEKFVAHLDAVVAKFKAQNP